MAATRSRGRAAARGPVAGRQVNSPVRTRAAACLDHGFTAPTRGTCETSGTGDHVAAPARGGRLPGSRMRRRPTASVPPGRARRPPALRARAGTGPDGSSRCISRRRAGSPSAWRRTSTTRYSPRGTRGADPVTGVAGSRFRAPAARAWIAAFSRALRPYAGGACVNVPNVGVQDVGVQDGETAYRGPTSTDCARSRRSTTRTTSSSTGASEPAESTSGRRPRVTLSHGRAGGSARFRRAGRLRVLPG